MESISHFKMQAITRGRLLTPLLAVVFLLPCLAHAATLYEFTGQSATLGPIPNFNFVPAGQPGPYTPANTFILDASSTPYGEFYASDPGNSGTTIRVFLIKGDPTTTGVQCGQWTTSSAQGALMGLGMTVIDLDPSQWFHINDCFLSPTSTDLYIAFADTHGTFTTLGEIANSIYAIVSGDPITSSATAILSVNPSLNATSTSGVGVSVEAGIRTNPLDFARSPLHTRVSWTLTASTLASSQCADVSCAAAVNFPTYTETIPLSGPFYAYGTTTPVLRDGIYTMHTAIQQPAGTFSAQGILAFFGFSSGYTDIVATTTRFTIGTSTTLDQIIDNALGYGAQLNSSTTAAALSSCSPLSGNFDIGLCASVLFLPSANNIQSVFNTAKDGILQRAPWGYISRVITIVGDTSTTTAESLPAFTVHVNTSSTSSTTLAFDPGDMLSGGAALLSSIKDPRSGLDLEEIVGPWVQLFIALSVIIIIFHDVMAMGHATKGRA